MSQLRFSPSSILVQLMCHFLPGPGIAGGQLIGQERPASSPTTRRWPLTPHAITLTVKQRHWGSHDTRSIAVRIELHFGTEYPVDDHRVAEHAGYAVTAMMSIVCNAPRLLRAFSRVALRFLQLLLTMKRWFMIL